MKAFYLYIHQITGCFSGSLYFNAMNESLMRIFIIVAFLFCSKYTLHNAIISLKYAIFAYNMSLDLHSMDKMLSKHVKILDFGHEMMVL